MYLITNGSTVSAVAFKAEDILTMLKERVSTLESQYTPQCNSSYFNKNYPNKNSFVAAHLRGLKVLSITEDKPVTFDWRVMRDLIDKNDVTNQFFVMGETETKVGDHITAQVVKKGLKSYGQVVVINDRIKHDSTAVAPTPLEWKGLYDKLARINCVVNGYGSITVAPDSLDNYQVTPKMKKTLSYEWAI